MESKRHSLEHFVHFWHFGSRNLSLYVILIVCMPLKHHSERSLQTNNVFNLQPDLTGNSDLPSGQSYTGQKCVTLICLGVIHKKSEEHLQRLSPRLRPFVSAYIASDFSHPLRASFSFNTALSEYVSTLSFITLPSSIIM